MANFVAVFDACVLYPASLRDLLLHLANRIHEEWIGAVLNQRQDLTRAQLDRTRDLMNKAVPDCLVHSYEDLVDVLQLPDANDRHVLAAAIRCQVGVIVTYNLKDFPEVALAPYGIDVQHPDEFVSHLFDLDPGAVCAAVRDQRDNLRSPPLSVDDLLNEFLARALAETVAQFQSMRELL